MKHLILASCVALAACGSVPPAPKTPAQAVYELTAAYAGALTVAVAYDRLPPCPAASPVCSTVANKAAIKAAVDRADPLVTSAQTIARATSPDATALANALTAAVAAVGQLSTITIALRTK